MRFLQSSACEIYICFLRRPMPFACDSQELEARLPRDSEETRAQLISAGERLFAERGIEVVSMREITRAAGQRNATALQYHFGDRRGLVRAILAKHTSPEEAEAT